MKATIKIESKSQGYMQGGREHYETFYSLVIDCGIMKKPQVIKLVKKIEGIL